MLKIRPADEIPFATALAMARQNHQACSHALYHPAYAYASPSTVPTSTHGTEAQRLIAHGGDDGADARPTRADRCYDRMRFAVMVLLLLFTIAVIVTLYATAARVERVLGNGQVSGSLQEVLRTLKRSADNVEVASENARFASGVGVAAVAETTASLRHGLNTTVDMIDRLRSFSSHPALHITV